MRTRSGPSDAPGDGGASRVARRALAAALCVCAFHVARADNVAPAALRAHAAPPGAMWLEELGLEKLSQRRGRPRAGRTLRGRAIVLGGVEYTRGIGTRSISEFVVDLHGGAARFQ